MEKLTNLEVMNRLENVAPGTTIHVMYRAGRVNRSPHAALERQRAEEEGIPLTQYSGTLESLKVTKKGHFLVTVWVAERDCLEPDGTLTQGNYRAFTASVGDFYQLDVSAPVRPSWWAL